MARTQHNRDERLVVSGEVGVPVEVLSDDLAGVVVGELLSQHRSKRTEDAVHDLMFTSKPVASGLLVRSVGVEVATQGFADEV